MLDYEQQSGDTMADAIKLPDASLREHLLLNSESYDRNSLWKSFIFFVVRKFVLLFDFFRRLVPFCRSVQLADPAAARIIGS